MVLTMPRISLRLPSTISSGPVAGISEDSQEWGGGMDIPMLVSLTPLSRMNWSAFAAFYKISPCPRQIRPDLVRNSCSSPIGMHEGESRLTSAFCTRIIGLRLYRPRLWSDMIS